MADVLAGATPGASGDLPGVVPSLAAEAATESGLVACLEQLRATDLLWLERTLADLGAEGVAKRRGLIRWVSENLPALGSDYVGELLAHAGLDQLVRLTSARHSAPMNREFLVGAGLRLTRDEFMCTSPEPYGVEALLYNIALSEPGAARELLHDEEFARWLLGARRGRHYDHGTRMLRQLARRAQG